MSSIQFTILPAPEILKNDVECLRLAQHSGEEAVAIKVAPSAVPGLVFQQNNGQSAIEQIITQSGRKSRAQCHAFQRRIIFNDARDFQAPRS
jgi:hypothetical protein